MPKPTFFKLPDDKRDRITELAIEEFSDNQYAQASISRIVARAGIAKGSFYQYFEDKLDLFRWLLLDVSVTRKIAFITATPLPETNSMFVLLEHLLVVGLQFGMANPRLSRVADLAFHRTPTDPALASLVAEGEAMGRAHWRAMLGRAQQAGEVRADLDLDLATDVMEIILRNGINVVMKRRFGLDMWEVCNDPEISITEEEARSLAADLIGVLRHGIGSGRPPVTAEPVLDTAELQAVMERARGRK